MVVRVGSSGGDVLVEPLVEQGNLVKITPVLFLGDILANFPVFVLAKPGKRYQLGNVPLKLRGCLCKGLLSKLGVKVVSECVIIVVKVVAERTEYSLL